MSILGTPLFKRESGVYSGTLPGTVKGRYCSIATVGNHGKAEPVSLSQETCPDLLCFSPGPGKRADLSQASHLRLCPSPLPGSGNIPAQPGLNMKSFLALPCLLLPALSWSAIQAGEAWYEQPQPLIEYYPGLSYESILLPSGGSVQSRYPSSSLLLKANGTAGQVTTLSLDGGPASHTRIAWEGQILDFGQIPTFDASLLPLELRPRADIYRYNFTSRGWSASSGIVNYRLDPLQKQGLNIRLGAGSFGLWSGQALWQPNMTGNLQSSWGILYRQAENAFYYRNDLGLELPMQNMDYRKAGLIQKLEGRNWQWSSSLTWKESGTGNKYSLQARQEDLLLLSQGGWSSSNLSLQAEYAYWENHYRDSSTDSHFNHQIRIKSQGSRQKGFYTGSWSLQSQTSILYSSRLDQQWEEILHAAWMHTLRGKAWRLQADLGSSWSLLTEPAFLPALGAAWSPDPRFSLDLHLSRVFQRPSFNDLFWPEDSWSAGNPDLLPEQGWQLRGGAQMFLLPLRLEISGLWNELRDMILWTDQSGKWRPENQGQTRSLTLKILLDYKTVWKNILWTLSGSWSWNQTRDTHPDSPAYNLQLIYTPEHQADLTFSASRKRLWEVSLHIRYTGPRFVTPSHTVSLPSYILADAGVTYRILYFSVNNLLNMAIQDVQGYPQPGLNLEGGVQLQW